MLGFELVVLLDRLERLGRGVRHERLSDGSAVRLGVRREEGWREVELLLHENVRADVASLLQAALVDELRAAGYHAELRAAAGGASRVGIGSSGGDGSVMWIASLENQLTTWTRMAGSGLLPPAGRDATAEGGSAQLPTERVRRQKRSTNREAREGGS